MSVLLLESKFDDFKNCIVVQEVTDIFDLALWVDVLINDIISILNVIPDLIEELLCKFYLFLF